MDKDKILLVRSAPIEQLGKCIEVLSQTYVNNTIYLLDRKDQLSKSMEVSDKLEEGLVFSTSGRYSIFNKGANQWPVKTFDKAIVMFRDSTGTGQQNLLYYMLRLNAKKLMSKEAFPSGNYRIHECHQMTSHIYPYSKELKKVYKYSSFIVSPAWTILSL